MQIARGSGKKNKQLSGVARKENQGVWPKPNRRSASTRRRRERKKGEPSLLSPAACTHERKVGGLDRSMRHKNQQRRRRRQQKTRPPNWGPKKEKQERKADVCVCGVLLASVFFIHTARGGATVPLCAAPLPPRFPPPPVLSPSCPPSSRLAVLPSFPILPRPRPPRRGRGMDDSSRSFLLLWVVRPCPGQHRGRRQRRRETDPLHALSLAPPTPPPGVHCRTHATTATLPLSLSLTPSMASAAASSSPPLPFPPSSLQELLLVQIGKVGVVQRSLGGYPALGIQHHQLLLGLVGLID